MNTTLVAIAASLSVGVVAGAYLLSEPAPTPEPVSGSVDASRYFDQSAAIDERVRALEAAVAEERNARQLLEDELLALYAELEALGGAQENAAELRVAPGQVVPAEVRRRTATYNAADGPEGRAERLVAAGFSPDRADWILQRQAELQMEAMQEQFEARRSGEPLNRFDSRFNAEASLRAEIGDADYEMYLEANDRSTAVLIGNVIESSPGHRAGLQAGDQIVAYDGTRVFNTWDLNRQTMQGEPGQSIVVDIVRDDMPMQVVLPRGPIGVSTGRFRGRR